MEVLPAIIIFLCLYLFFNQLPELHHTPATTYASIQHRGNVNDGKGRENKWVCIRNATRTLERIFFLIIFP